MKKHLIAAAVAAAVAVPATAQVTISGGLDIQAQNMNKRTTTDGANGFSAVADGATERKRSGTGGSTGTAVGGWADSQLVFTATEDLGGGLKFTGVFTQRITNDGSWGGNRDKFLDLAGGFGSVRFGRFVPAVSNFGGYGNNGTTNTAGHSLGFFTGATTDTGAEFFTGAAASLGDYHRQNGVIQYTSPSFSGFVATVGVVRTSDDTSPAAASAGKAKISQDGITVNYTAGQLAVGFGTAKRKGETEGAPGVTGKGDVQWLGARYDLGFMNITAAFGEREDEGGNTGAAQAINYDADITTVAVTVPLGAYTLMASMYDGKDSRTNAAADNTKFEGNQMSAHYAFSKRTTAYVVHGQNKLMATTGVDRRVTKETSLGIRHSF